MDRLAGHGEHGAEQHPAEAGQLAPTLHVGEQRQEEEEAREDVTPLGRPGHRLDVQRMHAPQERTTDGPRTSPFRGDAGAGEQALGEHDDKRRVGGVGAPGSSDEIPARRGPTPGSRARRTARRRAQSPRPGPAAPRVPIDLEAPRAARCSGATMLVRGRQQARCDGTRGRSRPPGRARAHSSKTALRLNPPTAKHLTTTGCSSPGANGKAEAITKLRAAFPLDPAGARLPAALARLRAAGAHAAGGD
jgi:hypothetical protein